MDVRNLLYVSDVSVKGRDCNRRNRTEKRTDVRSPPFELAENAPVELSVGSMNAR